MLTRPNDLSSSEHWFSPRFSVQTKTKVVALSAYKYLAYEYLKLYFREYNLEHCSSNSFIKDLPNRQVCYLYVLKLDKVSNKR